MADNDQPSDTAGTGETPRPAAVTFVTTEHFVLQGARASTIAEATGRASMFLASVSGGLVALGLVATASGIGAAFYVLALVLLPTLTFVGLVTFERALQTGAEDYSYARRIALLRSYYFDHAPEITPYLLSVQPSHRLQVQGLAGGRWQGFRTVAGMVGVITATLSGSSVGLAVAVISGHHLVPAVASGAVAALVVLTLLMRVQRSSWERAATAPLSDEEAVGERAQEVPH